MDEKKSRLNSSLVPSGSSQDARSGDDGVQGKRILIVDDDPELLEITELIFSQAGARVHSATDGREALRQFYTHQPDLVLLDLMMPALDGWQVCRRIRQLSDLPIILLTALGRDEDVVRGLDCGADDYVTKPFSPQVLLARARAALRPGFAPPTTEPAVHYDDGHLAIDLDQRRVLVRGEPVKLSVTEYELLAYLVRRAGRVLTFRQILKNVWDEVSTERPDYVHTYISYLRYKLEPDPRRPVYFLSERGVGYRFAAQEDQPAARPAAMTLTPP